MGDDRERPRPPRELPRQRSLESHAAPGLRARGEAKAAAVVRQRAGEDAIGEHDDLVDQRRERADLRHGGRERRVAGIDLLRDEDQPPHRSVYATRFRYPRGLNVITNFSRDVSTSNSVVWARNVSIASIGPGSKSFRIRPMFESSTTR